MHVAHITLAWVTKPGVPVNFGTPASPAIIQTQADTDVRIFMHLLACYPLNTKSVDTVRN
eukprot:m.385096 g.385096  ORF g.385096 m.385096 type:complete len:60 (+) comp21003_c0_seq2:797-976(+)